MRSIKPPFASQMNFLDQQQTEDGQPYGPVRYKEIVEERFYIAKHGRISYADTGKMTPTERDFIKQFILDDAKHTQEMIDEMQQSRKKT